MSLQLQIYSLHAIIKKIEDREKGSYFLLIIDGKKGNSSTTADGRQKNL